MVRKYSDGRFYVMSSSYFRNWRFPTARNHPLMFSLAKLGPVLRVSRRNEFYNMTLQGPAPRTVDRDAYFSVRTQADFDNLRIQYAMTLDSYLNGTKRVNLADFELTRHHVAENVFIPQRERDEQERMEERYRSEEETRLNRNRNR